MNALEIVGKILFSYILWGAVFAEKKLVGGLTFNEMLFYYVISSFIASFDISRGVSGEISYRIRGGSFTGYMVLPTNALLQFVSQSLGTSAFYALFTGLVSGLCAVLFKAQILFTTDLASVLCAVLLIAAGLVFMIGFHFLIGILAFKFLDIGFFLHIQSVVLELIMGGIIPLVLLPSGILRVLRFVPFIHTVYTPSMLLMGKIPLSEGLFALANVSVCAAAVIITGSVAFKVLRVKYDGVGV
jgi:ABC-2 type transport system permease protein